MSIPADVYHPQDEKAILPFNPPGTFAPGTFAPGSIAPGVVPVLVPSYPLQPRADVAGGHTQRPVSHALQPGAVPSVVVANGVQHQQLYPQTAFPPQAVVAHPRSASMPTMGDPNAAGLQTYSVTTYYTAQGIPVQSQASMVPAEHLSVDMEPLVQTTIPQQAITVEPRHSMPPSGHLGSAEPHSNVQIVQSQASMVPAEHLSVDMEPLVQTTIPQQAITVEPRHPMPPSGHLGSAEPHSNVQIDQRASSPQPPGHVQSPSWSSATPTIVGCSPLLDRQLLYPNRTPPRRCKQLRKCPTHRPKLTWPENRSPLRLLIKTRKSLL
jgi:hypothetical protein